MAHARPHAVLRLECCALHTESPVHAAHAPAQVEAACKRGAHVIGLTEVNPHARFVPDIAAVAARYGYNFVHGGGDTAELVQARLKLLHTEPWGRVSGERGYTSATFRFHGHETTVFCHHFGTNVPAHHAVRAAEVKTLVEQVQAAAFGRHLAFYMGDVNPDRPLKDPEGFPRADLDHAGLPLIYEELNTWPEHIGVTALGHARKDHLVEALAVDVFDALDSDHRPVLGQWKVAHPKRPLPIRHS